MASTIAPIDQESTDDEESAHRPWRGDRVIQQGRAMQHIIMGEENGERQKKAEEVETIVRLYIFGYLRFTNLHTHIH